MTNVAFLNLFHRYKNLLFLSADRKAQVMERVFDLLEKDEDEKAAAERDPLSSSQSTQVKVEAGTPTVTATVTAKTGPDGLPIKKRKSGKPSLASRMYGEVADLTQPAENFRKEVLEYQGSTIQRGQTVLQWWAIHEVMFPHIAHLAKCYLSIPATEVNKLKILI